MPQIGNTVCVIGTGVLGLVTTKNLIEQGLDVTAFEKNDYIGGLWHETTNAGQTSALKSTTKNTSKQLSCFTDFPYPDSAALNPTAQEVNEYLESYAKYFDLIPRIRLSIQVIKVERDDTDQRWVVYSRDLKKGPEAAVERTIFDRVVFATGQLNVPVMPEIKGADLFAGDIIHSRDFKDASKYSGKRVVVVGVGASGADTQSFLKKSGASEIFLSHRGQFFLLARVNNGIGFDHVATRRMVMCLRWIGDVWPRLCFALMNKALTAQRKATFPELNGHPCFKTPRLLDGLPHRIPMFSDDLATNLASGAVQSVPGIKAITGPSTIELNDGSTLHDIDAIIVCSGYRYDFSAIQGRGDPSDPAFAPDGFARYKAAKYYDPKRPFARLYRGFLSEQYPESLAFIGHLLIPKPPFVLNDLMTMALASLWSGSYKPGLPSAEEMAMDIDAQYDDIVKTMQRGVVPYPGWRTLRGANTYEWLNKVAGTGVDERLGNFGAAAWKFWWSDRKFYSLLMDGLDTPAVYRLFETGGGRKIWSGARKQIEKVNLEVETMGQKWKEEQAEKKKK